MSALAELLRARAVLQVGRSDSTVTGSAEGVQPNFMLWQVSCFPSMLPRWWMAHAWSMLARRLPMVLKLPSSPPCARVAERANIALPTTCGEGARRRSSARHTYWRAARALGGLWPRWSRSWAGSPCPRSSPVHLGDKTLSRYYRRSCSVCQGQSLAMDFEASGLRPGRVRTISNRWLRQNFNGVITSALWVIIPC